MMNSNDLFHIYDSVLRNHKWIRSQRLYFVSKRILLTCRCAGSTAGPLEYTENQTKMEEIWGKEI